MMPMLETIRETARQHPQRQAFCSVLEQITYETLWSQVESAGRLLRKQGSSPVLLYGKKGGWMLTAMLACLAAKRAYVPLHRSTPQTRLNLIAAQTGSTLLLCDKPMTFAGIDCCTLPQLRRFSDAPEQNCQSDIVYIIFTSGSTGTPKGMPISKTNLNHFCGWIRRLQPLSKLAHPRILNTADFSFDLSVADLAAAFCSGGTLVSFDAATQDVYDDLFPLLATCDAAVMTPTCMRLCLLDRSFCRAAFPRFSCVYFCGEPLDASLVKKLFSAFPDLQVLNAYGPTEATSAVCASLITPADAERGDPLPAGNLAEAAVRITIENDEIVLCGNSVFGGYLGQQPLEGGCYHTGDCGWIQNGKLYCRGRKDRQIKYKGYRIELDDIEQNLASVPGVHACAVTAKKKPNNTVSAISAFYESAADVSPQEVQRALQQRLPAYMMPRDIRQLDKLPVNENGKTDRKALEKWPLM